MTPPASYHVLSSTGSSKLQSYPSWNLDIFTQCLYSRSSKCSKSQRIQISQLTMPRTNTAEHRHKELRHTSRLWTHEYPQSQRRLHLHLQRTITICNYTRTSVFLICFSAVDHTISYHIISLQYISYGGRDSPLTLYFINCPDMTPLFFFEALSWYDFGSTSPNQTYIYIEYDQ